MIIRHRGFEPVVDSSSFVAQNAVLAGNVRIGPSSRIMYGAVLDSEGSRVEIGRCTIVCENGVLRATALADRELPLLVGENVFIGPHATLLGCCIEARSYIATGATVLQGAAVLSGALVAVGALVHAGAVVPEGFFVPPYSVAIGNPVEIYGPHKTEAMMEAIKSIRFSRVAFGIDASEFKDRASLYERLTEVRSQEFGSHLEDSVLNG